MKLKNKYIQSHSIASVALTLLLHQIPQVHAADGTWTSASPYLDPSSYWSNASNWSGSAIANGVGATASTAFNYSGSLSFITLDTSRTIGNISFNGDLGQFWYIDPINSSAVLTLATNIGNPTISVADGVGASIYAPIAGTQGFTKQGLGVLSLHGQNTYTGTTRVSGGSLWIETSNLGVNSNLIVENEATVSLGSLTQNVAAVEVSGSGEKIVGGSLVANSYLVSSSDSNTISANLGGLGAPLTKTGSGTTTLSGANTYTGVTNVNGGMLHFAQANSLYNAETANWTPSNISVDSGATISVSVGGVGEFTVAQVKGLLTNLTSSLDNNGLKAGSNFGIDTSNATGDVTFDQVITDSFGTGGGSLGLTKLGEGKLILNQVNTHTGLNTVSGGTLAIVGPGTLGNGNNLRVGYDSVLDLGGTLQHVGSVLIAENGSITNGSLSGTSYEITGSQLYWPRPVADVSASLGGAGASLNVNGGNAILSGVNSYTGDTNIVNGGSITISGAGTLGSNSDLVMNNGDLDLGGTVQTVGSVNIVENDYSWGAIVSNGTLNGNSFDLSTSGSLNTISAGLAGTGANLTKTGSGKLTLSGINNYSGTTTVSGGVLHFDKKSSLYNAEQGNWTKNRITVESGGIFQVSVGPGDSFSLNEAKTLFTELSTGLNNNGLMAGSGFGLHSITAQTFDQAITDSSGVGGGALSLYISGFGLTMNQVNTYTGTTYLNGSLTLAGSGTLGHFNDLKLGTGSGLGGGLDLGGSTQTVDHLTLQSGLITNGTLVVGGGITAEYGAIHANLSGSGAGFTKNGNAESYVTLSGTNNYGGPTTVESGTLMLASAQSLYNANQSHWVKENITVNSGGVLGVAIGGDSGFTLTQAKNLLSNLTTSIDNNGLKGGSSFAISTENGDVAFDQVIANSTGTGSGSLGLIKEGANALTLNQSHTYTGQTVVKGGSLVVNGNISTSIQTTVNSGASISGSGTVGKLVVEYGGSVSPGNSPGILNTGDLVLEGTLNAEILGNTVGTHYDQMNVTGTVTLIGALSLTLSSFVPQEGDLFFLINNDLNDAVIGTFAGLDHNSTFWEAGQLWSISYSANFASNTFLSGNDVALKAIPETSTTLLSVLSGFALLKRRRRK